MVSEQETCFSKGVEIDSMLSKLGWQMMAKEKDRLASTFLLQNFFLLLLACCLLAGLFL
jgi:hypothetical protein